MGSSPRFYGEKRVNSASWEDENIRKKSGADVFGAIESAGGITQG